MSSLPKRRGLSASARRAPAKLAADLVAANHILFQQGVLDALGHVSVRDPRNSGQFWMSRSIAPALVTAADIMQFDLEGEAVNGRGRRVYLERFIHSEIYKSRSDVMAVVHTHSPTLIPFADTATPLRPLSQNSGFLGEGVPVFDIRSVDSSADLLIRNSELGRALARALGEHSMVLLRGHGSVGVGSSLQQLVWRAIYAEVNARQQIQALMLGTPVAFLSRDEARHASATVPNDPHRAWDLWRHEAEVGLRNFLR